jgi:hypothetical protein
MTQGRLGVIPAFRRYPGAPGTAARQDVKGAPGTGARG